MTNLKKKSILLVEDEPVVLNFLHHMLAREGYFVLVASDGLEGLEVSRSFPHPIDMLISDVQMPRMNGLELAKHVSQERPETRIVLISGHMDEQLPNIAKPPDFLRKPFVPKELLAKIREVLERPIDGVERI